MEWMDVGVLLLALILATWLIHRRRSRPLLLLLGVFCIGYFGFYKLGCVCPIGSVQNVSYAFFADEGTISLTILAAFLLPLLFAFAFGRVFCSAVCPFGALQELVLYRPRFLPLWADHAFGYLRWVILALAVLLAGTATLFLLCAYDPFIGFFRLSGPVEFLLFGAALIVLGLFVGRPYCRFLCPYGALLGLCSRFAEKKVRITPRECVHCRLCEESCPYGAIRLPENRNLPPDSSPHLRRFLLYLVLLPVLCVAGWFAGSVLFRPLAELHPSVSLERQLVLEEAGKVKETTDASKAFRDRGLSLRELRAEAGGIRNAFETGGAWVGLFLALVLGLKLLELSRLRVRLEYEADPAACVGCARCFEDCPVMADGSVLPYQEKTP